MQSNIERSDDASTHSSQAQSTVDIANHRNSDDYTYFDDNDALASTYSPSPPRERGLWRSLRDRIIESLKPQDRRSDSALIDKVLMIAIPEILRWGPPPGIPRYSESIGPPSDQSLDDHDSSSDAASSHLGNSVDDQDSLDSYSGQGKEGEDIFVKSEPSSPNIPDVLVRPLIPSPFHPAPMPHLLSSPPTPSLFSSPGTSSLEKPRNHNSSSPTPAEGPKRGMKRERSENSSGSSPSRRPRIPFQSSQMFGNDTRTDTDTDTNSTPFD